MAVLNGTAGNDSLTGTASADSITGFEGNDTMLGGDGNDVFVMSSGAGTSYGADSIDGGAGFDVLDFRGVARSGINANISGSGATLSGGGTGGAGSATVVSLDGVIGGDFNDRLVGGGSANLLEGGAGSDTLDGSSGNDTLRGGLGTDTVRGGSGNDQFVFAEAPGAANADRVSDFVSGTDKLVFDRATFAALGSGDFVSGDDRFISGAGLISGQDAEDRLIYNTSTGELFYDADGSGSGGALLVATLVGIPGLAATDIAVTGQAEPPPSGTIVGTAGNDSLTGTDGSDSMEGLGGNDTIDSRGGNDTIDGGDGDDSLDAGTGSDIVRGGNGDDTLSSEVTFDEGDPEDPPDTLDGGQGNDTYNIRGFVFSELVMPVLVDAGGIDTVLTDHHIVLPDGIENLELFEAGGGTGNALDNVITTHTNEPQDYVVNAGDGNDTLIEGGSRDLMRGERGDDRFVVLNAPPESGSKTDTYDGGEGFDFVDLGRAAGSAGWSVDLGEGRVFNRDEEPESTNAELTSIEGVSASPFDDVVSGSSVANVLQGGSGNDALDGKGGNDTLTGGTGADAFSFTTAPATANADLITDFASGADKLRLDASVMTNLGASGNFSQNDGRFFAAAGATGGNDADDRVVYNTTTRQVFYDADGNGSGGALLVATLQPGAALVATDIAVDNGSAPETGRTINGTSGNDSLVGGAGNDSISGFAGNDTLAGNAGNDTLDGGSGTDALDGGLGNDTFRATAGDVLMDSGGVDLVITDASWTLGAGFENVEMLGSSAINVTGNELGNFAIGNSAANYFNLRSGNDTIQAGGGNDRIDMSSFGAASYGDDSIDGGAGFDTVSFTVGSGQKSAVAVDLAAGTASGGGEGGSGSATLVSVEGVFGAQFADRLSGSSVANRLEGRAGNDTLSGLGGNDTLVGGTERDTFVFASAPGSGNVDVITDFVPGTDELSFENGVFTALGASGAMASGDGRFRAGAGITTGQDPSDRLIYNTNTDQLYYDADGSGSGGSVLVASFTNNPTLTATDFTII